MTRKQITTRGHHGATVNVFADTVGGEPVVRCEWRETDPLGRKSRKTETFRGPKRDAERQAKAFAEAVATRLTMRERAMREKRGALGERAVRRNEAR